MSKSLARRSCDDVSFHLRDLLERTGQRTCQLLQLESGRDMISEGRERRSEVTELSYGYGDGCMALWWPHGYMTLYVKQ